MPPAQHSPSLVSTSPAAQQYPAPLITAPTAQHVSSMSRLPLAHVLVSTAHVRPPQLPSHSHAPAVHTPLPLQSLWSV